MAGAMCDRTGNLPPLPGIFPDYAAPIVRNQPGGRELTMARWGMPSPVFALKGKKSKEGETTNDIFAFLTTEPNKLVGAIHPKAMPVILTKREEIDIWMMAPPGEALKLQRPLPDDALMIVARGEKKDEGGLAA
jgi:putative SOS response-associated peptidase YedK